MGSTSQRSKTTSDLQNDNLSHIAQLYKNTSERFEPNKYTSTHKYTSCEPNKYTGDDQGRVEVNHASLGAGQVKNRILCLLEKYFYRLVEGKYFQVSDSPTKDKVG